MYTPVGKPSDPDAQAAREAVSQKLRELPRVLPPPFGWEELQQRRSRRRAERHPRAVGARSGGARRRALALAACAVLLVEVAVVASRFNRSGPEPERRPARAETAQLARPAARTDTAQPAQSSQPAVAAQGFDALLARADAAERWLASEPDDGPVVRVSTHLAVAHLEDRIASMDDLLNLERLQHARAARLRALQLQRAQLVDSLAQVRYAEILTEEAP